MELLGTYANRGYLAKSLVALLRLKPHGEPEAPVASPLKTRQRQHRLSDAELDELEAAYRAGELIDDLAARFDVNRATVIDAMRRRGVPGRWSVVMTPEKVSEARKLYEGGLSLQKVADRLGVSVRTIHPALQKVGVEFRDTRGRERK